MNDDIETRWNKWVASRPETVQGLCRQFPPFRKYWLDPPGQVVSVHAYCEDGTLTVIVDPEDNPEVLLVGRRVFGIKPEDMHELDDARP